MNNKRIKIVKNSIDKNGPVIYWMQRDQRVNDNWALIYACQEAERKGEQLIVVFNVVEKFLDATIRQYHFMIEGLKEVKYKLQKLNIVFEVLIGSPNETIPKFLKDNNASLLVADFNPLKIIRKWKREVNSEIDISFHIVDAHNIVPVWEASKKLEFAAYTIRPKIKKLLPEFLDEFHHLNKNNSHKVKNNSINWENIYHVLKINNEVKPIDNFLPGENAANKILQIFIENKIDKYSIERNDPNLNALSSISPYLHFGQISAQRIALILNQFSGNNDSIATYLEELIIRRELADNFCYYNSNYDTFDGFHDWAKKSLNEHRDDKREYNYNIEQFESANTHDNLWNAAQVEMKNNGKMHGFMRMYWAKKILEWTESPEQALEFGIYLNDKYQLDGRDPNGYAGLAWSIGGVHDRAWQERPVYGKIRYMNYNGCKRKFDVNKYINRFISNEQELLFK